MASTPPNRNPKRQRQKEGAQARRAAELAALRRQQRNRRVIRIAVIAVVAIGAIFLISALGGDDDSNDTASDASSTTETTAAEDGGTTTVPLDVTPPTCEGPTGENTDLATKPTVEVPAEKATELTCTDLVVGDGEEVVSAGDSVSVQYVGVSQSTGEEFDASWTDAGTAGDPVTFGLSGVIRGWSEGIPGMKVGGRRVLVIPGSMAYGPDGNPGAGIGPDDTLVFVVDLVDVQHVTDQ